MVDKKQLFRMGDEIQATIRAGELDRAIELLEEFLNLEGADRRWGLSLLQTTLKNIRDKGVDKETDAALAEQEKNIREELLAMDADEEAWLHRWERARQLNNQAWADYEAAESKQELLAALEDMPEAAVASGRVMGLDVLSELLDLAAAPHRYNEHELRDRAQVLYGTTARRAT